jgi:hypothetical protein
VEIALFDLDPTKEIERMLSNVQSAIDATPKHPDAAAKRRARKRRD